MAPHEERVLQERMELSLKCRQLQSFFGTLTFKDLPFEDQSLLRAQFKYMKCYEDVLEKRIARFGNADRT